MGAGERAETLNYQHRNRFQVEDFRRSAALYAWLRPELMVSGHWRPHWVDDAYLAMLAERGEGVVDLHRTLLPDELDLGADSILARLTPYYSLVRPGAALTPRPRCATRSTTTRLGHGRGRDAVRLAQLGRESERLGVLRLGQYAEALLEVVPDGEDGR